MSYEGYQQKICEKGHLLVEDCWGTTYDVCPECNYPWTFINSVDQTNDEGFPYTFELLDNGMSKPCDKCECVKVLHSEIYKIPSELDIKNYRLAKNEFYNDLYGDTISEEFEEKE